MEWVRTPKESYCGMTFKHPKCTCMCVYKHTNIYRACDTLSNTPGLQISICLQVVVDNELKGIVYMDLPLGVHRLGNRVLSQRGVVLWLCYGRPGTGYDSSLVAPSERRALQCGLHAPVNSREWK